MALILSSFFSWSGFFMVIPLMAVHYVDHLGWAAGTIGIVLAVRQFAQQGLTAFFGILSDRVGPRGFIAGGMLIRAIGFGSMAYADEFVWVAAASVVVGLGGAMFESPKQAMVATLTNPIERRRYYSTLGMIGGIGTTVGTQIGAMLIGFDFAWVCLAAGVAYLMVALLTFVFVPPVSASIENNGATESIWSVFRDATFMRYVLVVSGYWFAWTQFGLTITLAAVAITGAERAVSWIYLVNAVVTVSLGYVLPRVLERWLSALQMQIAGVLAIGLGLLMVGLATDLTGILLAAGVFSVGAVMARPGQETVLADLVSPSARGTYFGISASVFAIGGGLGNYLGGVIYDVGGDGTSPLPWIVFSCIALATAALLWLNRERFGAARS